MFACCKNVGLAIVDKLFKKVGLQGVQYIHRRLCDGGYERSWSLRSSRCPGGESVELAWLEERGRNSLSHSLNQSRVPVTTHKRSPTSPLTRLPRLFFQPLSLCPWLLCHSIGMSCSSCSRGACLTLRRLSKLRVHLSDILDSQAVTYFLPQAQLRTACRLGYRAPSHLDHATAFQFWSISRVQDL